MRPSIYLPALCVAVAVATVSAQLPTFRSSTAAVAVDVSVRDGRRPVTNLAVEDFQLWDNDVPQRIDAVEIAPTSIDLTAILDLSGSASPFAAWLLDALKQLRSVLRVDDRAELLVVGRQIRSTTAPRDDADRLDPPLIGDGGSHIFDAVAAAAMKASEPGRRHLVIAFTDGLDSRSVVPEEVRQQILGRSNAVVELFVISTQGRTNNSGVIYNAWSKAPTNPLAGRDYEASRPSAGPERREGVGAFDHVLQGVAEAAGGQFYDMRPTESPADELNRIVEFFRHHYVLKYRPEGVASPGWHALRVSIKSRRYDLVARRGYDGGR